MEDAEKVDPAPLESTTGDTASLEAADLSSLDLSDIKRDRAFRTATTLLLAGKLTVPEWEWYAVRAANRKVDLPWFTEAMERAGFQQAFEVLGKALEGFLVGGSGSLDEVTKHPDFRKATIDLLNGQATVPDYVDVAGKVLNAVVDIPYVPEMGENLIFDRGLEFIANTLHDWLSETPDDS